MKINKGKYFTLLLTILIVVILGGVAWKLYPYVLQRIELSRFQSAVETIETINQAIVQASKEHPGKKLKPSMLFVEDTIWEEWQQGMLT